MLLHRHHSMDEVESINHRFERALAIVRDFHRTHSLDVIHEDPQDAVPTKLTKQTAVMCLQALAEQERGKARDQTCTQCRY